MRGFCRPGEAIAVSAELDEGLDPLACYAALSDGGTRADTILFEQEVGATLLLDQAAVRAECRGAEVRLIALSANGQNLLDIVGAALPDRVARRVIGCLTLQFPKAGGTDAEARLRAPSPFDALRAVTTGIKVRGLNEPCALLATGIIAYDHVDLFEDLPLPAEDPLAFPDYVFWIAETLVLFEQGKRARAIAVAFGGPGRADDARASGDAEERLRKLVRACAMPGPGVEAMAPTTPMACGVDLDDAAFCAVVRQMKAHIEAGDVYQIVPSRTFSAPCPAPLAAYATLRKFERAPYSYFVAMADLQLFGASPETAVRVSGEGGGMTVEVKPIAGTRPRGASPDEDDRLEAELKLDQKELAEHMMLVDLSRNDVARISVPGTRRLAGLMSVQRHARVMHLVSRVAGSLRPGLDAFDALKACLNVGTLTGAPKIRAMQLLRDTEATKRGPYGGAIGWIRADGAMDSAVIIRTALVRDGIASVRAGAGIVHDSDPQAEADETWRKASALLSVLGAAR